MGGGKMTFKKGLVYCALVLSSVGIALGFQNCAKKDSDSGGYLSCAQLGANGVWYGSVLGNPDVMTITENCTVTSTYCGSKSKMEIIDATGCPAGSDSCGTVLVQTSLSNRSSGCLRDGVPATCAFVVWGSGQNLTFNCGNSSLTYSR